MLRIAITGSTGLIGSRVIELLKSDFEFVPILQEEVDITNKEQVFNFIKGLEFDLLFHMAGFTNVDAAEKNKELVYKVNVEGTKNVFYATLAKKSKFIYVSTDFVFDGTHPPYFEDSPPNPLGYYAQTKYEGEKIVGKEAMIVRLSYPYRAKYELKRDFVSNIRNQLEQQNSLRMVIDSVITPTLVDDIAFALKYLFNNFSPEIFHIVGADSISPYEAGKLIAKTFNFGESLIRPFKFEEYIKGRAKRSQYSEIKSKKNNFYKMKTFAEGLRVLYNQSL